MNMNKISHEMNLQKWSQVVQDCRSSGQTTAKWCAENNINVKSYYYWQRKVCNAVCSELAITDNNAGAPVFSEIMLPGKNASEVAITISLNNVSLQIHNGADEAVISQTLRILKSIC
jgi:hypothetical protein